ncbi:FxsA family protein [Halobacteriaceae archaeon GCM10025711]
MFKRLLAALLLIPLADALLLVVLAQWVDWQVLVLLVVLTALVGMLFVRAEGRHTLRRLQQAVAEGSSPENQLIDGGLLLVAGAFLLTPGLVTDGLGFLFVIPPTRAVIRTVLKRFVIEPYVERESGGFVSGNVYTFGFPNDGGSGGPTGAQWGTESSTTYDLGPDAYDVEFEDDDRDDE